MEFDVINKDKMVHLVNEVSFLEALKHVLNKKEGEYIITYHPLTTNFATLSHTDGGGDTLGGSETSGCGCIYYEDKQRTWSSNDPFYFVECLAHSLCALKTNVYTGVAKVHHDGKTLNIGFNNGKLLTSTIKENK